MSRSERNAETHFNALLRKWKSSKSDTLRGPATENTNYSDGNEAQSLSESGVTLTNLLIYCAGNLSR